MAGKPLSESVLRWLGAIPSEVNCNVQPDARDGEGRVRARHPAMRFAHLGIVARRADALAAFYGSVFGCREIRPPRSLSGEKVSRGNGVPNSQIRSIWLTLPGIEGPFLEIHEYAQTRARAAPHVNEPGYAHLAFTVEDIRATRDAIVRAGGRDQGEITELGPAGATFQAVYMRDPEGNVIELEQF